MKKLKWVQSDFNYYADTKTVDFRISKSFQFFQLSVKEYTTWKAVACFKKLQSAKKVAQLIYNG